MLSCSQHDFLEVACLYHYELKVELLDGKVEIGVAQDLLYREKQHCLVLQQVDTLNYVDIASISKLSALTQNPYFDTVIATD
ncbi:Rho-binding antiterminator [Pseudoalteromonas fenneropenaei]|uniref:Rho-binding antiterminator n=1 Tax=Pseudoalteromonas fenneropenaei TaxID=1737459 RepID=A0ABV7CJ20_9GAMM